MLFYVAAEVPCLPNEQSAIWWKVAKKCHWSMAYEDGKVKIYGRRKTPEEIQELHEVLSAYPRHSIYVEEGDI